MKKNDKKPQSNPNSTNNKQKKNKDSFSVSVKRVVVIALVFAVLLGAVVGGAMLGFIDNSTELIAKEYNMDFTSIVYSIDEKTGEPVEYDRLYSEQNRIWVDLDRVPENLKNAFIAIEDERFLKHRGLDIKRTFGAFLGWITGNDNYGGSTITQQLIKNVTGDKDRSPIRKIREIIRAVNLETKMSKDQIIEMYMNTIYLGQGCHGVQTAANVYFSKDVSELTLEECASIAGITQYPAKYDPLLNYEEHKKKQETVLGKMEELGYITKEECEKAKNAELKLKKGTAKTDGMKIQSYFIDQIVLDVQKDLMVRKGWSESEATKAIFKGGLKIYSTIDPKVQRAMENVFTNESNFPGWGTVKPQSAMIVIDPYTGYVRGIIGGRGEKTDNRGLNRATQTLRQPGSSIKPLSVYAPAIEMGVVTPATIVDDSPLKIGDWEPRNADYKFRGKITVREALEWSRNIPAVRILDKLTVNKSFNFMTKNLKISTLVNSEKRADGKTYSDKFYSSLGLGGLTDGVSVMEMTAAYSAFVNGGVYTKPITYTKVIDSKGRVILENKPETQKAMSDTTAYTMAQMMRGVVLNGTGGAANLANGVFAAGKTGTTSDDIDRWFVGYTPNYVGGVWFGYDKPQKMSGLGNPCASLWKKVMDQIHKDIQIKKLVQPNNMTVRAICQKTGKIATGICEEDGTVRTEYFKIGTQPTSFCSSHMMEETPENQIDDAIDHEESGLNENEPGAGASNPPAEGTVITPPDSGSDTQGGETSGEPSDGESNGSSGENTGSGSSDVGEDGFVWWTGE